MEVREGHRAEEKMQPSVLGGLTTASRFAVLGMLMTMGGDDRMADRPAAPLKSKTQYISTNVESTLAETWTNPDDLRLGETMDLIGQQLLIVGETRIMDGKEIKDEDIELEVRRSDGEIELIVNGKAYRIQDSMSVDVGKSILSAELTDGIITIVTDKHGTAKVDKSEVKRIVRDLAAAQHSPVRLGVSTNFAPEGMVLSSTIAISRLCRGWKEGDKECYDIGFEALEPDSALAMARQN